MTWHVLKLIEDSRHFHMHYLNSDYPNSIAVVFCLIGTLLNLIPILFILKSVWCNVTAGCFSSKFKSILYGEIIGGFNECLMKECGLEIKLSFVN